LKWIVNHQSSDGSWHFRHRRSECDGRCGNEGTIDAQNAATGLALMALLGAGNTHKAGKYQGQVEMGLDYLVREINYRNYGGSLIGDEYQSNAGIETLPETKSKAKEFIDSLKHSDGVRYGYQAVGDGDIEWARQDRQPSCTAIGNLMQMYFGRELEHPALRSACQYLADAGSSGTDVYFDYYTTLVLHHARAPQWKRWNQTVRDNLIRTQQKHGHEAGSWFFADLHGNVGGRLYTTAMAVMTLEVYYRFMPLYKVEGGEMVRAIDTNQ
jgi:hypothetical protein